MNQTHLLPQEVPVVDGKEWRRIVHGVGIFPRVLHGSPACNYMDSEPDVLRGHIGEPSASFSSSCKRVRLHIPTGHDPKQLSKQVQEWFVCRWVTVLDWPSQIHYLNVTGSVSSELIRRLAGKYAKHLAEKFL